MCGGWPVIVDHNYSKNTPILIQELLSPKSINNKKICKKSKFKHCFNNKLKLTFPLHVDVG